MSGEHQLHGGKSESTLQLGSISAGDATTAPGSGGAILYKFGQEMPPSSGSRGAKGMVNNNNNNGLQPSASMPSFDLRDQSMSGVQDEETVLTYLTGAANNKHLSHSRSMKLVSGSQFRLTSHAKGMIPPHCEQCDGLEKLNKKNKEIIRTLKLQLTRMEESYRDLKYSKTSSSSSSGADQPEANGTKDSIGDVGVKESNLRRKCEYLEDELNKFKKMLTYERSISDQLKQTLEDERAQYKTLNETLQQDNEKLKQYIAHLEATNQHYKYGNEDLQGKLLAYKQQLEKTEQKLNESLE